MLDTGLILYEFPCSEKIRFYLRLEALKQRLDWFLSLDGKAAHQAAINALFDLSDVAARSDLKTDPPGGSRTGAWAPPPPPAPSCGG